MNSRYRTLRRRGYTLLELVAALGSATVLMLGLASALVVAGHALDRDTNDHRRAAAADVQFGLLADLRHATVFTERTANAVTIIVPDRTGDGQPDVLRYAWSGTPGDPLTCSVNGSTAQTLVANVHEFDLSYRTASIVAPVIPPQYDTPPTEVFGNETVFTSNFNNRRRDQIATRVTLGEPGTIESITAYVGGTSSSLRFAIYGDAAGEPADLLAQSAVGSTTSSMNWVTIDLPSTALPAGSYWLALSFESNSQTLRYQSGGATRINGNRAVTNGFSSTWGSSTATYTSEISIYATYVPD